MNYLTKIKELVFQKNDSELALKILQSLSIGYTFSPIEKKQINNAIKDCKSRQEIINKAIELCGEPNTPKKRYIYAKGYAWSNKEYRQLAIKYITLYLNNPLYENAYINKFKNIDDTIEKRKLDHICDMKEILADIYMKVYEFEKSLQIYEELIKINPTMPIFYRKKTESLIRLNRLDECITFLKNTKKSKYYKEYSKYTPTSWFISTIDELLEDSINKKINGYMYKPRK